MLPLVQYGGDGVNTIGIPNIPPGSSLVQAGVRTDFGSTRTFNLGTTGGAHNHILMEEELASHTHTQVEHSHSYNEYQHISSTTQNRVLTGAYGAINSSSTSSVAPTINATGEDQPHNNMPPYFVVKYILRYQ